MVFRSRTFFSFIDTLVFNIAFTRSPVRLKYMGVTLLYANKADLYADNIYKVLVYSIKGRPLLRN